MAKYVLTWKYRQAGTGQQNHEDARRLTAVFAGWKPAPELNFLQFLQRVDGQGGVAVVETDSPSGLLAEISKFAPWEEFDVIPVIEIAESMPIISAAADFRESI